VVGRAKKVTIKKHIPRLDPDGVEIIPLLGSATVESYTSAIMDLWKLQYATLGPGLSMEVPIRPLGIKSMLKVRKMNEAQRKRDEFVDRGSGTLLDGYSQQELIQCVRLCWQGQDALDKPGQKRKRQTAPQREAFHRTIVDLLWSSALCLRGDNLRRAELCDLFTLPLEGQGGTPCPAMVLIINNGKTNQAGKIQYSAAIRHQNPLLCALGAFAFYLFFRWNIIREPPPTFRRREHWYRIKTIKGGNNQVSMAFSTQLDWIKKIFLAVGISSEAITHAGRKFGPKWADALGVTITHIRRAGHWASDALCNAYLLGIAIEFIRAMAGFSPQGKGDYWIPRANIPVPDTLAALIWPWVDENLAWFDSNEECESLADEDRNDLAGKGFLRLLVVLRTTLIQDSVLLRKEFPDNSIFSDPFFQHPEYLAFARGFEETLSAEVEEPQSVLIQRAVPILADRMTALEKSVNQKADYWGQNVINQVQGLRTMMEDIFNGRRQIRLFTEPLLPQPQPQPQQQQVATATATATSPPYCTNPPPLPYSS
jgi:hypothetical protein